jgi:hypothetical protein
MVIISCDSPSLLQKLSVGSAMILRTSYITDCITGQPGLLIKIMLKGVIFFALLSFLLHCVFVYSLESECTGAMFALKAST